MVFETASLTRSPEWKLLKSQKSCKSTPPNRLNDADKFIRRKGLSSGGCMRHSARYNARRTVPSVSKIPRSATLPLRIPYPFDSPSLFRQLRTGNLPLAVRVRWLQGFPTAIIVSDGNNRGLASCRHVHLVPRTASALAGLGTLLLCFMRHQPGWPAGSAMRTREKAPHTYRHLRVLYAIDSSRRNPISVGISTPLRPGPAISFHRPREQESLRGVGERRRTFLCGKKASAALREAVRFSAGRKYRRFELSNNKTPHGPPPAYEKQDG